MWAPERTGRFLIRVVDDHGRTDSRDLSIGAVE
jgi:penicillin-binding protein 1C